jgi:hypothetical protein
MNRAYVRRVVRFALSLRTELPQASENDLYLAVNLLLDTARSLHRLNEQDANVGLTERQRTRQERLLRTVLESVRRLAADCPLIHGTDPRGVPLLVRVPSGRTDDFAGRGLVVPLP